MWHILISVELPLQAADYLADTEAVQMLTRILGRRLFHYRGSFSVEDGNEDPVDKQVISEVRPRSIIVRLYRPYE